MYTAWCFACLGGGIDTTHAGAPLVTLFSVATLAGSSLCTSMSMTEEVETVFRCLNLSPSASDKSQAISSPPTSSPSGFAPLAALTAVTVPLVAALVLEGDDGLTVALAIAGSFGSPVLYGLIPALMAWRQRQASAEPQRSPQYLIPSATLPVLGALSTGFVGQELWARLGEVVAVAS
jgi:Tryptophan/tyrosine permease family